MPAGLRGEDRPLARWQRQRAWAASILVVGLLLFVWPFVRTPPLSIGLTYAHLLGAWALIVLSLLGMSRALRASGPRRSDDA